MKPKEGTILTVARGISEKAAEVASQTENLEEALLTIIEHAEYVLSTTPDLLPVLKEAGVVDSGGQGLVVVLRGMYDALTGKVTEFDISEPKADISEKHRLKVQLLIMLISNLDIVQSSLLCLIKSLMKRQNRNLRHFYHQLVIRLYVLH